MQKGTRYARAMHDRRWVQIPDAYHTSNGAQDKRAVRVRPHVVGAHEKFRGQAGARVRSSLRFLMRSAFFAVRTPSVLREATHGAA